MPISKTITLTLIEEILVKSIGGYELMNVHLTSKQKETLDYIQKQRDYYENFENIQSQSVSFVQSFVLTKEMMGFK